MHLYEMIIAIIANSEEIGRSISSYGYPGVGEA